MDNIMPKISIYDFYKPLRNHLRRLDLQSLLELIYRVKRNYEGEYVVKVQNYASGACMEILRHELHILAREAMLHAQMKGRIPDLEDLRKLINQIRRITEEISKKLIHSGDDALRALHPLVHQQVRWQRGKDWDRFYRTFRIYSRDEIRQLFREKLGIRLSSIYILTFVIVGGAKRAPWVSSTDDFTFLGVSNEERDAYFRMFSTSYQSLKLLIAKKSVDDERWAYTWNPLEGSPLIQLHPNLSSQYICPLPEFLMRRVTDSLFFDLINSSGFDNLYGHAFENYVGEVLNSQFDGSIYRVLEEKKYWEGKKQQKHGIDWIVSDTTGHIMFECKTRRITVDAKAVVDGDSLLNAIGNLAKMVVQHYKNIKDALKGLTQWLPDGLPIYPVIVTLDDWYLFATHVHDMLQSMVEAELSEIGLLDLIETTPFIITSIAEWEMAGQAAAQIGITKYFSSVVGSTHRHFSLSAYASNNFPDINIEYKPLFENTAQEMFKEIAHLIDFENIGNSVKVPQVELNEIQPNVYHDC